MTQPMTMRESRLQWDQLMHKDLDSLLVWRTGFNQSLEGRPVTKRRPGRMNSYEAWIHHKVQGRIRDLTAGHVAPLAVSTLGVK